MHRSLLSALLAGSLAAVGCTQGDSGEDLSQTLAAVTTTVVLNGTVTGPGGLLLQGATIAIPNGAPIGQFTDAAGNCSFPVDKGKPYTVTATLAGCAFPPPSATY